MADWSINNILPNLQQALQNVGTAASNVPGNFVQKLQDAAQFGPQNLANAWQGARNVWSQPVGDVLSNAGTNALTGLGLALGAPKQAVYQQGNQFANALGSTAPDVKNFKDILVNQGMDPNALTTKGLGLAGDIATDPMTYALAGPSKLALQTAGKALFGQGAKGLATAPALRGGLSDVAVFRDMGRVPFGEVPETATHLTSSNWVGRLTAGQRALYEKAGVPLLEGEEMWAARRAAEDAMRQRWDTLAESYARTPEIRGGFVARANAVGVAPAAPAPAAQTLRHELTHALINKAAQSGETQGLPMLVRIPALLQRSAMRAAGPGADMFSVAPGVRGALAQVGHEVAGHALANRGLLGQLGGARQFLFNPGTNQAYVQFFTELGMHPGVLAAYRALPWLPRAAGMGAGVGGAVGASALLEHLRRQSEE